MRDEATHRTPQAACATLRKALVFVCLAGVMAAAAGCGSSSSSSGAASGAAGSASIAKFQAAYNASQKPTPDTYEGPSVRVKAPSGIKLAGIVCDQTLPGCGVNGALEAAKHLGWTTKTYNGASDPGKENSSILNAITWGANVILLGGIDPRGVQQGLRAAKKAHILVGSTNDADADPNPSENLPAGDISPAFDISPNYISMGASTADAIITASKGTAHVLVVTDNEFWSVGLVIRGALREFKACSGCKTYTQNVFGASLTTTAPQQIVGFLRSHPDINYLYLPYDAMPLVFIPAIRSAGLGPQIKGVTGLQGNAPNVNLIKKGDQLADVAFALNYTGWAAVDQINRLLTHKPLARPEGENTAWQLLTKADLPAAGTTFDAPFAYKTKFERLWG